MTARFANNRVLVTGAAGGIGAAVARAFRSEGASVAVSDIKTPDPTLGVDGLEFHACDVTQREAVFDMVDKVAGHGTIDCLVHSAAILGGSGPYETLSPDVFMDYLTVNVMGCIHVTQAVANVMIANRTPGSIVTFGSVNSTAAERNAAPYVASKGAVRLLTRAMAVDLARHGIRVNIVRPGAITVPRNAEWFARPELTDAFNSQIPQRRAGLPEELVGAALYLADPANSYTTGSDLVVDGGLEAFIALP